MTEREKMLSGLLYDPSDPELSRSEMWRGIWQQPLTGPQKRRN